MPWRWRYETWHFLRHVLFGLHSPTRLYMGTCWCQRWRRIKARTRARLWISPR